MTHKMSDQDVLEHLHQALDHIVSDPPADHRKKVFRFV